MRSDFAGWKNLWTALAAKGEALPWHERLLACHDEGHRHYHNRQHLEECLAGLDRVHASLQQPAEVEVALWFHDAVYDPRSPTNEEDSAALAADCLSRAGVAPERIEAVRELILGTKLHQPRAHPDSALLLDLDLAILGREAERFWEYERAIRAEYAWVPAATFAGKRAEILTRFLERPSIYFTDLFRRDFERAARRNLAAAIAALGSPARETRDFL